MRGMQIRGQAFSSIRELTEGCTNVFDRSERRLALIRVLEALHEQLELLDREVRLCLSSRKRGEHSGRRGDRAVYLDRWAQRSRERR